MAIKAMKMCIRHNRELDIEKFYRSKNPYHTDGRLPYCKDCLNEIFDEYLKRYGTIESAMYHTCVTADIPFNSKVYLKFEEYDKEKRVKVKFGTYLDWLQNKLKIDYNGFCDTDVPLNEINGIKKAKESISAEIQRLELDWGKQDDDDDYNFLVYMFEKYTKEIEFDNPQQEDLYRDLCRARLSQRKIEEGRSGDDANKVQARILSLMKTLRLDEFDSNKPRTLSEQSLFEKIRLTTENNVADIYKKPNSRADYNKILKYNKDMSLRPLANMLVGHKDFNINLEDVKEYDLD